MQTLKIQNQKISLHAGFTLVETLVAISILMIALATPLSLAQKGIAAAELSKDQMTASYLAQDGVEAVKNIRDQTAVSAPSDGSQHDWLAGLDGTAVAGAGNCICTDSDLNCSTFAATVNYCNIDTTANPLVSVASIQQKGSSAVNPLYEMTITSGNTFVKYDLSNATKPIGFSNTASKFVRKIDVRKTPGYPNEAAVNVQVSWMSQIGPQNITIKDFIYNYAANIN